MPTCYKCRQKMIQGFTELKFDEDGKSIVVRNVPAFICPCGESQVKGSIAKYISNLIDEILKIEKTTYRKKIIKDIHVGEIALA
ncbi:MAG: YgiT-type zinc finger protein [bacterium]